MSRKALSQYWPLGLACATIFIAIEATNLRGQNGSDVETDLVFDRPATPSSSQIQQAGALISREEPISKTSKSNVAQSGDSTPQVQNRNQITRPQKKYPNSNLPTQMPRKGIVPSTLGSAAPSVKSAAPATAGTSTPATPSTQSTPQNIQQALQSTAAPSGTSKSSNDSNRVTQTGHYYPTDVIDRDGGEVSQLKRARRGPPPVTITTNSTDQPNPPGVRGALFGLQGTTATERLYQLQNQFTELQRENDDLRRENAGAMSRLKESQDQLLAGAREIQLARKELSAARGDLDRLRNELQMLREKVRLAEKEHSAVLQTIGPILQQLLEADDVGALPPQPVERD